MQHTLSTVQKIKGWTFLLTDGLETHYELGTLPFARDFAQYGPLLIKREGKFVKRLFGSLENSASDGLTFISDVLHVFPLLLAPPYCSRPKQHKCLSLALTLFILSQLCLPGCLLYDLCLFSCVTWHRPQLSLTAALFCS